MTNNRLGSLFFFFTRFRSFRAAALTALTFLAAIFSAAPIAKAQWAQNTLAPNKVTCIRWLQDEGFRKYGIKNLHHGLLGGGQSGVANSQFISYCPSGITPSAWTAATFTPAGVWNDGWISDFAFEDSLVGYASIYGASSSFYGNPQVSGMMKTTDGGATWVFLPGAPAEIRGMFYDWVNDKLFCSSGDVDDIGGQGLFSGAWVSTNHGVTWARINVTSPTLQACPSPWNQRCYYTGFASWDGTNIVLATEGSPNPCTNAGSDPPCSPNWLYSNDGGTTWKTGTMTQRSWQPVALSNTQTFYASSNPTPPNGMSAIYSSLDNGKNWSQDQHFVATTSNVTEVMGGDPCIIVAPDSTGPGNFTSGDDGITWSPIGGAPEPQPPIDYRSYVGGDSIWLFTNKQLQSSARPQSNPLHWSPTSFFFAGSGCGLSDTVIKVYGCNCNNVVITGSSVQQIYGTGVFSVSGLTTPQNVCGAAQFHVQYQPNSTNQDSAEITINYTNSGSPQTLVLHAKGNGAPTDFQTSWGSKPQPSQNPITLFTAPCQRIDTGFWIYNPTCADFQVVQLDGNGDNNIISFGQGITLPFTIPQKGGMQFIPITGISSSLSPPAGYHFTITIRTQSGGVPVTKIIYVTLFVQGSALKPFVRSFDIHVKNPCFVNLNGQPVWDSAVYYFDTTCLAVTISKIRLEKGVDFALDPAVNVPVTLQPINSGSGIFLLRVPVKLLKRKKGTYTDVIDFEDVLNDGTTLLTKATVRYTIDNDLTFTPKVFQSALQHFPCVTPCDSTQTLTFKFQSHNDCGYPDTITGISTQLNTGTAGYPYKFTPPSKMAYKEGDTGSIVIGWPNGLQTPGPTQRGYVILTFRNGSDSGTVRFDFDGSVCTGPSAVFAVSPLVVPDIRLFCDTLNTFDSLFNNSCVVDVKVDQIENVSGRTATVIEPAPGTVIKNGQKIPIHLGFSPGVGDTGQVCGVIRFKIADVAGTTGVWDTLSWCVQVNQVPIAASVTALPTSDSLACGKSYDATVCIKNTAACGRTLTFTNAQTTVSDVTVSGAWPVTLAPDSSYCFPVHIKPSDQNNAGVIEGDLSISGDTSFTLHFKVPYQACSHTTILTVDSAGKTLISTPRCITANDTMTISVSAGTAIINSITMSPTGAYTLNLLGATTPETLSAPATQKFFVSFNPDAGATGDQTTVTIQWKDADGALHTEVIPLKSDITGSHYNSQLALSSPEPALIKPDMKQTKTFIVTLQGDPVPATVGVTALKVDLKYNTNLLINQAPTSAWGTPTVNVNGVNNLLEFTIPVPANTALVPGTQIATITMTAAVTDSLSTNVSVTSGTFNPSDANFARCTLAASSAGEQIPATLDLSCTDSFTYIAMRDGKFDKFLGKIEVIPNPAHKSDGAAANLSFTTAVDANGAVDIVDMTGKTVAELAHGALTHGDHIYSIPTTTLSEGTYFARIQVGGFTVVRKFVLQKD